MIEEYFTDRLGKIYVCVKPGGSRISYLNMITEGWQKASSVDRRATNLVKVRWQTLRSTKSYGTISGQNNSRQQLFYIRDTGVTNIRVPFYFYSSGKVIILFAFKKKDKSQENRLFVQAAGLQIKINKWIKNHDFSSS